MNGGLVMINKTETKTKGKGWIGLIILLVVFGFMAIGSSGSIAISSSDDTKSPSSVQVDGDEVKAADQTGSTKKDQRKDAKDTAENQKKAVTNPSDMKSPSSVQSGGAKDTVESIEEQVILDKNGIKITAKGLDKDGFY